MRVELAQNTVQIVSSIVNLQGLRPVINGTVIDALSLSGEAGLLTFELNCGVLRVAYSLDPDQHCWFQYWLEGLPADFRLASFGLQFETLTNLRAYLRNGYFSWDGSDYIQAELYPIGSKTQGYAMTQLLPLFGTGSVVLGFDRHDRFQHTFAFERTISGFSLTIETVWDEKDRSLLNRCESERLMLFEHEAVEAALRVWAQQVAQVMSARLTATPIMGWCSWYNLYAAITEENILQHLQSLRRTAQRENLPLSVFQIDDGFTPEMGDWLEVKPQFPHGMKPVIEAIRLAGYQPGLWIAPFMVGNRSHLYREHPDWVVKDRQTGRPLAHLHFYSEFRWHKRSEEYYILDTTHPAAFDYLRHIFRTWRQDWGCEYFKTDFMQFGSEYGPDRAIWYQPGKTRIEIWRQVAVMIREEIGEALWLGCGCPLWASVGLVDAVRIGRDVGVQWSGKSLAAQSLLRDQATRNFANHILWQSDPDCILLREEFHLLSAAEVRSLALYAGMSTGLVITSDDLGILSPERLRLWKLLLSSAKSTCCFPLLGQSPLTRDEAGNAPTVPHALDPVLVQVRTPSDRTLPAAVLLLNTSEYPVQRTYPLTLLGLPAELYLGNWMTGEIASGLQTHVDVILQPHDSVLYFLSDEPLLELPSRLP